MIDPEAEVGTEKGVIMTSEAREVDMKEKRDDAEIAVMRNNHQDTSHDRASPTGGKRKRREISLMNGSSWRAS